MNLYAATVQQPISESFGFASLAWKRDSARTKQQLTTKQTQINIAGAKGLYIATVNNKVSGKQFVSKIIVQ